MSSTRLPGKSLMDICGKPLIWHVLQRALKSIESNEVVLATTTESSDDPLYQFALKNGFNCFRGLLDDVLDRYYQTAKANDANIVVRITGDCPLVDPQLIDEMVRLFKKSELDYVSNGKQPWMDGFDVEVFSFHALEIAWKNATLASEREHVTPYIRKMADAQEKSFYTDTDPWFADKQMSVDRPNDLELIRQIYAFMFQNNRDHNFTYQDVKALLIAHPKLSEINKGAIINEGYTKSLKEDKKVK